MNSFYNQSNREQGNKIKRFDDIFKLWLTILTIIFSFSLAYQRFIMPTGFYSTFILILLLTIIFWSVGHTRENIFLEVFLKFFSWFLLMYFTVITVLYVTYGVTSLKNIPIGMIVMGLVAQFYLVLPVYYYFRDYLANRGKLAFILFFIEIIILTIISYFL